MNNIILLFPKFILCDFADKPGKPEGPLEVSDVHKEGCKLKWSKPKDDGGLPLSSYIVEKMDVTTGRWVPAGIVDPEKTEHTITGLEPGHKYEFRVKAVNEEGESEPLQTDIPILAKNPYGILNNLNHNIHNILLA
jgi:predicted phage tail protein